MHARHGTRTSTLLLMMALASPGLAAPGDLDPTFGDGGVTATTIRSRRRADANDVVRQADGKFIVAGVSETTGLLETVAVVARYDAAGHLDPSFGIEGVVELGDPGLGHMAWRAALQSDGKILVAISTGLQRLFPDGTPDPTLSDPDFGPVAALATLPDDRIYALIPNGVLSRRLPDGSSDVAFNGVGLLGVVTPIEAPTGMAIQSDGKILVSGASSSPHRGIVVRVNDDGTLDGSFGVAGEAAIPGSPFFDVDVQSNGKIVVAGSATAGQFVARFDSVGSLDPSFGGGGSVTDPALRSGLAVQVQANGKIVVVGGYSAASAAFPEQLWQLSRYTPSGTLDASFATGGVATAAFSPLGTYPSTPPFSSTSSAAGLLLEPDGRIVAVGQLGGTASQFLITRYEGDCADGVLDPNEACDDGNLLSGDCCSRQCAFDPAGTRCAISGDLCTNDVCDALGSCLAGPVEPATGCIDGTQPGSASLLLKDVSGSGDLASWRWRRGEAVSVEALGDPTTSTDYALCVYEESGPTQLTKLDAPAGGPCGSNPAPCWKALGSPPGAKGYRYRDDLRASNGLDRLLVKPGPAGKPQAVVSGKGPNLTLPGLPIASPFAIRTQLKNSVGLCLEARYTAAQTNTAKVFRATSE
jgi:uncharacterized delta-60 repeat protein